MESSITNPVLQIQDGCSVNQQFVKGHTAGVVFLQFIRTPFSFCSLNLPYTLVLSNCRLWTCYCDVSMRGTPRNALLRSGSMAPRRPSCSFDFRPNVQLERNQLGSFGCDVIPSSEVGGGDFLSDLVLSSCNFRLEIRKSDF